MRWMCVLCLICMPGLTSCQPVENAPGPGLHFDFGSGPVQKGYTQVLPDHEFTPERGYGFIQSGTLIPLSNNQGQGVCADGLTSERPFYFTMAVPEGNYRVTVTLGDGARATETTIKAELRRLMVQQVRTETGEFVKRSFVVNVRTPRISEGRSVGLKSRERTQEVWAWDGELTLEFNGTHPCVCAVDVVKVDLPTVYLLGDSTVCDQSSEPWNSWGQMLPRFFKPTVAVANHAESGESIRSSLGARRFDKVYSQFKPGDYLFVQFGHNDMKSRAENASDTYKSDLKAIVARVRELGGTPVLVTSMERKSGMERDTLRDYPARVREVAAEDKVALIDLHKQSKILYRVLGANLDKAFQDGTHHNNYGSYLFAKCVAQGIRDNGLPLAMHLADDFQGFDPARPDAVETFDVPASPMVSNLRPLGD